MSGSGEGEVERLRRVYAGYRASARIQAQWDGRNPGNRAIEAERRRGIGRLLGAHSLLPPPGRVLDVGCGSGRVLAGLRDLGAQLDDLYGIDLLAERIVDAQAIYPEMHFSCGNAEALPFPDAHFALLLLFTVFSSILDGAMARNVTAEAARVLAPGGAVLWYDFRFDNPRNPHVRGVTAQRIAALFPGFRLHLQPITLLPPLARRLGRLTPALYPPLAALPFLRTHYLGLLVKLGPGINGRP